MIPHPNQTDQQIRERAAALRAASHCCQGCRRARVSYLLLEVYQDGDRSIVLCYRCVIIRALIAKLRIFRAWLPGWR